MNCCRFTAPIAVIAIVGASLAFAQHSDNTKKPTAPAAAAGDEHMQLPPNMTEEDMKAYMEAATPGPMQEYLVASEGTWKGECTQWMAPGADPQSSQCTSTTTSMMDGRFVKCEVAGEMPGMGMFNGFGLYGYDNVGKTFQCTWIDNMGTGMMQGTGELSSDKTTLTWTMKFNCPIAKKCLTMKEIDKTIDKNNKVMEMWGPDPKSGEVYKVMEIKFTRESKMAHAGQ
ncbi:MAG TPA: DUF1579 family protein [Phycisphaerales bacterium]|nr:DUF1579 family protein [Phycisphaerales bacterium]